jgi:hypothetical protein
MKTHSGSGINFLHKNFQHFKNSYVSCNQIRLFLVSRTVSEHHCVLFQAICIKCSVYTAHLHTFIHYVLLKQHVLSIHSSSGCVIFIIYKIVTTVRWRPSAKKFLT